MPIPARLAHLLIQKKRAEVVGKTPAPDDPPCPPEIIPLLATQKTKDIAETFKLSARLVNRWRLAYQVPRRRSPIPRPADPPCPPELLPLLATIPAGKLAEQFSVSRSQVRRWRIAQGIRGPSRPFQDLSPSCPQEVSRLLGTAPDSDIAEQTGHPIRSITAWRTAAAIPRFSWQKADRAAQAALIEKQKEVAPLLGFVSDRAIATTHRLTRNQIVKWREAAGIDPPSSTRKIMAKLHPQLGQCRDTTLAKRFSLPQKSITALRRFFGIPEFDPEICPTSLESSLGLLLDKKIAEQAAVSIRRVRRWRKLCDIPPPFDQRKPRLPNPLTPHLYKLGKMPDTQIAAQAGVTRSAVAAARKRHGIQKFARQITCTPDIEYLLGKTPDTVISKAFRIPLKHVRAWRLERGLAPAPIRPRLPRYPIAEIIPLLGTMTDLALAKKFNITLMTVFNLRRQRQIAAFSSKKPR